ncbi:hypothetical protein scyTo_0016467 [Scyliorhinus torazame]|uniref:Uncharacterized protein n=1 Tax=Scyliorhinus torazame TaxID=75743 RepID=A0A401PRK5_SCYTO|nr:hypothetical protein [Scyliorhinus torazame]
MIGDNSNNNKETPPGRRAAITLAMMVSGLPPRFAPPPPKAELRRREKAFLLDCVAVSSIAKDHSQSAPRAASIIPPYNPLEGRRVLACSRSKPLPPLFRKTGQPGGGTSIQDRFQFPGAAASYLRTRNQNGAVTVYYVAAKRQLHNPTTA